MEVKPINYLRETCEWRKGQQNKKIQLCLELVKRASLVCKQKEDLENF